MTIMVLFISPILYLLLTIGFSMFEYISRKIRNKTLELPFTIPGESTKGKIYLRDKQIVESEIGFLSTPRSRTGYHTRTDWVL